MEVGTAGHNFGRGSPTDHSTKVWSQVAKWFQRRIFLVIVYGRTTHAKEGDAYYFLSMVKSKKNHGFNNNFLICNRWNGTQNLIPPVAHRYPICGPPHFFLKNYQFITFVGRFHYKQCWTTSNITKISIRDRYKPISKNTKTLDPLLYYIIIEHRYSLFGDSENRENNS